MEKKTIFLIFAGILTTILYIILSYSVKDTKTIWIMTRLFGLLAYVFLFITILLGELRLLSWIKGSFTLFRFHTPAAIFSTYLVLLHFIAALADNFKWGKTVTFVQYLGFSYSDK